VTVSKEVLGSSIGLGVLNGVPRQVTEYVSPLAFNENFKAILGLYAQDQWKVKRLALNLGARFDWLNAHVPAQQVPAGTLVPARTFPAVSNVPNWIDVSPRFGGAYDLFGDGKTALKASLNRYVGGIDVTSFTVAYQGLPGPQILANYVATNAQIVPSLGRNLSAGANGTATVPLIAPGTLYAARLNQTDFRVTKIFTVGKMRMQGNFDLYNLFNNSAILTPNTTYGPQWQQPNSILQGRLVKFGGQLTF
jgi:hypothetical protein